MVVTHQRLTPLLTSYYSSSLGREGGLRLQARCLGQRGRPIHSTSILFDGESTQSFACMFLTDMKKRFWKCLFRVAPWPFTVAPDGSLILLREHGRYDVYSLSLSAH